MRRQVGPIVEDLINPSRVYVTPTPEGAPQHLPGCSRHARALVRCLLLIHLTIPTVISVAPIRTPGLISHQMTSPIAMETKPPTIQGQTLTRPASQRG